MAAAAEVTAEVALVRVLKQKAGYAMEPAVMRFKPGGGKKLDIREMDVEMEGLTNTEVIVNKTKVN